MDVDLGDSFVACDDGRASDLVEFFAEMRDVDVGALDADVGAVTPSFFFGDVEGRRVDDDAALAYKIFDARRVDMD